MQTTDVYLYSPNRNKNADFSMWMAFPGPESFALSSLGFLWMFKSIDEIEDVNIEYICTDTAVPHKRVEELGLIGFSFTFDTDFLTIFSMLEKYHIPLKACERGENFPLIFAGGPVVTANPAPYSDFFDFFVIGDGEDINLQVVNICKDNKEKSKSELLDILNNLEGIYIPSRKPIKVKKLTKRLEECIYTPIISERAFFKNTFILEVARGCANRCGFCLASYLNLPLRFMHYEDVINAIETGLMHTDKIALLGAQLSAHPQFAKICEHIYKKVQEGRKIEMSVSSLRVDAITPEILKTLVATGQKNITLAIEAGSERLRKVINKHLEESQIMNAVDMAVNAGLKGFKFYGMTGLPTETMEDIDEMIALAKRIKEKYKSFNISFGFSTFVPKPNTPFQWYGREVTASLEQKAAYLKKEMHKLGIDISVSSAKWDYWQAVLSRGDNTFGDFLIDVYRNGGKLGAFKSASKKYNINADYYALENYPYEKELPWDFIDIRPGKAFLIEESTRLAC